MWIGMGGETTPGRPLRCPKQDGGARPGVRLDPLLVAARNGVACDSACATMAHVDDPIEPGLEQILEFCAGDPVERVFLEDVARRGLGRFSGFAENGRLTALCHVGANVVPSGRDCGRFAAATVRGRARMMIGDGRSWVWIDNGTILFKAEASAWTPSAVQLQQVWVDPPVRNRGYAQRGMRDLIRLLLERVPTVCLFVRPENAPAIRVYEAVGMRRHGSYRSLIF